MKQRATMRAHKLLRRVLDKADKKWKQDHGDKLFGGSFLAPTPSVSPSPKLNNNSRSTGNTISPATSSDDDNHQADYGGWKFYDGPLVGEPALNVDMILLVWRLLMDHCLKLVILHV
jgi:hypothetical protein